MTLRGGRVQHGDPGKGRASGGAGREHGRHPFLKEVLVLKGGTALNMGFGAPTRLSVDLDFNYIGAAERSAMLEERPRVEEATIELARRAGYRVQQSAEAFAGRKIYLHFRSAAGPRHRCGGRRIKFLDLVAQISEVEGAARVAAGRSLQQILALRN